MHRPAWLGRLSTGAAVLLALPLAAPATSYAVSSTSLHRASSSAAAAAAAPCVVDPDNPTDPENYIPVVGDIDADGAGDVVIGLPHGVNFEGQPDAGAIDVELSGSTTQHFTRRAITGQDLANARFGASVSLADVDHNFCADAVVGAPGEDGSGAVYVALGTVAGLTGTGATRIVAPTRQAGAQFGAQVALSILRPGGATELWVGAPGETVAGQSGAGVVYHYEFDAAGAVSFVDAVSYARSELGGVPRAGDRFGSVVVPGADGGAVVGVPRRAVGGKAGAGQVVFLTQTTGPLTAQVFSQATAGVPGKAKAHDRFGAAVSVSPTGGTTAVGIPGEDTGGRTGHNAGAVQVFQPTNSGGFVPGMRVTQDSPGIPGRSERGDHFGAAVSVGRATSCQEASGIGVGAPGENVRGVRNAGAVTVFTPPSDEPCDATGWSQGNGLPGRAEIGDRVGQTLGNLRYRDDFDEDIYDTLLVGVPREDVGTKGDAGIVIRHCTTKQSCRSSTWRPAGGAAAGQRFGAVIATDASGDSF